MNAGERIIAILDYYSINGKILSERIGLDRAQAIYDIINGKTRSISERMASKIISAFSDINKAWLMSGEGEMLKNDFRNPSGWTAVEDEARKIPLFDCDYHTSFLDIMNGKVYPSNYIYIPGLKADGAVRNRISPFDRHSAFSPEGVIFVFNKVDIKDIANNRRFNLYLLSYFNDSQQEGEERIPITITTRLKISKDRKVILLPPGFSSKNQQDEISIENIVAIGLIKASITFHTIE